MIDVMVTEKVKHIRIDDTGCERTGEYGYRILFKEENKDRTNENVLSILLNQDELITLYRLIKNRVKEIF